MMLTFPALQHKEGNASITAVLQGLPQSIHGPRQPPLLLGLAPHSGGGVFLEGTNMELVSSPMWAVEWAGNAFESSGDH